MRFYPLAIFLGFTITGLAQLDSAQIELFVNAPFSKSDFSVPQEIGVKFSKKEKPIQFMVAYSRLSQNNNWIQYFDEANQYWTFNSLVLHNHSKDNHALGKSQVIKTTSNGIRFGLSTEKKSELFTLFGSVSIHTFFNKIAIAENNYTCFIETDSLSSGLWGRQTILQGTFLTPKSMQYNSIVPVFNGELGAVFTMNEHFKLIPKLNFSLYPDDTRIRYGSLYNRTNNLESNVRLAIQLSYIL